MQISQLNVQNFKSLRNIELSPSELTIIIGANGSGKSNLASAFDFLSDVYQNGLEFAIAKKGGYENIAYRKVRRTKSPISFSVEAILNRQETTRLSKHYVFRDAFRPGSHKQTIRIKHNFAIQAVKQSIRSEYSIQSEELTIFFESTQEEPLFFEDSNAPSFFLKLSREDGKIKVEVSSELVRKKITDYFSYFNDTGLQDSDLELFVRHLISPLAGILGAIAVHQFSPQISRSPGAPSPQPRLTGYGQNLPSLVDWLKRHHAKKWRTVETAMRDIIPGLEEISIEYLHTKQLGLFFKEKNFGRAWTAEDVSDGTIQTLAILSAIADPRNSVIFLEEPENSVHPWIVRQIATQLKKLSPHTQIIVTTHSPLILNIVDPKSVWICFKQESETKIESLSILSPELVLDWENGVDRLFELIDTGSVGEAVPIANQ